MLNSLPARCADEVLETVPLIMQAIGCHMRSQTPELSLPQFRAMVFVRQHPQASLSDAAGFVGLGLSRTSKLVNALVSRDLMSRHEDAQDRRRVRLALTPAGQAMLENARQAAAAHLARTLAGCTEEQRTAINNAMQVLRPAFNTTASRGNGQAHVGSWNGNGRQ